MESYMWYVGIFSTSNQINYHLCSKIVLNNVLFLRVGIMAKIPIKPIVDKVITNELRVGKFLKENWKDVAKVGGVVGTVGTTINDRNSTFAHRKSQ